MDDEHYDEFSYEKDFPDFMEEMKCLDQCGVEAHHYAYGSAEEAIDMLYNVFESDLGAEAVLLLHNSFHLSRSLMARYPGCVNRETLHKLLASMVFDEAAVRWLDGNGDLQPAMVMWDTDDHEPNELILMAGDTTPGTELVFYMDIS